MGAVYEHSKIPRAEVAAKGPSSGLSATFSHARAREKALKGNCLLPFEKWEKLPEGRMRALVCNGFMLSINANWA
jgi:hypothetical protein